ncbi:MAG: copper resistance protein CopC [Chloroflexi bacterium]|nr:copper resistance protein CopC [Chloroflexota bacterium]
MRRERSVRRLALIAFLAVALVFALPFATPAALAHANLVTADPTPNASLTTSPTRVTLHFSEAIAPSLSGIQVLNAQGKQVDNKDAIADPANSMTMWVTLPSLPDGTYTVVWHNTSDVDGHAIRSSYAFGIGVQVAVAPQTAQSKPPLLQSQGQPYLRWAVLIGAMAIVGGIAFRLLILEPVLTANTKRKHFEQARAKLLSRVSLLLWCTAALFIIASVALLMNQAGVVTDKDWYRTLGAPLKTFLIHTSYGKWWIWRMGCFGVALLALGVASRVESAAKREMADRLRSLALVASVVALLTFSLSSHGAAIAEVHGPAVMSDFIHLLSASVWGGGLLYLVLVVPVALSRLVERPRREFLAALVPRFSRLATISVAAILVSGLYNSWAQVSSVGASTQPYGLALIAKVALVVPLLVLGALNPKWISKRLAGDASAGNMLRVLVAGEAVLIVLVVLAAGWMTSLEPARTAHAREQNCGALRLDSNITNSGDLVYTLDIKPAQLGPNTLMLTVRTRAGGTRVANATDVRLTLTYLDKDLGSTPVTAQNVGGGRYVADNVLLSIAGGWQTEVFISRPGGFDFRDAVRFPIGGPGSSQAPGLKDWRHRPLARRADAPGGNGNNVDGRRRIWRRPRVPGHRLLQRRGGESERQPHRADGGLHRSRQGSVYAELHGMPRRERDRRWAASSEAGPATAEPRHPRAAASRESVVRLHP